MDSDQRQSKLENTLSNQKKRHKPHEFTNLPEFDKAMRKLVDVKPETVRDREEARTPRKEK